MKLALAQINSIISNFDTNSKKILEFSIQARDLGADIVVFPELSLCGYPAMDLLDQPQFVQHNRHAIEALIPQLPPDIAVLLGCLSSESTSNNRYLQNVIIAIKNGKIVHTQAKTLLPTYDVFDEARYFRPAESVSCWNFEGRKIGIAICEDIWWGKNNQFLHARNPIDDLLKQNVDLIIVSSASPFYCGKLEIRQSLLSTIAVRGKIPLAYVNAVGANDSLIFDGRSFYVDAQGNTTGFALGFEEDLVIQSIPKNEHISQGSNNLQKKIQGKDQYRQIRKTTQKYEEILSALQLGIRDYLSKTGFDRAHLGLSGGVDSSLVFVLAVLALGKDRVTPFLLPSRYSSKGSIEDSLELCHNLDVRHQKIEIDAIHRSFENTLHPHFEGSLQGITDENLQARIRANILMAWSNKYNSLLLSTGNKTEIGVGYCTLYGDMAGAISVIGDLFKTEVYELCNYINRSMGNIIPQEILSKEPSAELRPNQKDRDSLPPYPELDAILRAYIFQETYPSTVNPDQLRRVLKLVVGAEYKRFQSAPVLKVSPKSYGNGRRMPLARSAYEVPIK